MPKSSIISIEDKLHNSSIINSQILFSSSDMMVSTIFTSNSKINSNIKSTIFNKYIKSTLVVSNTKSILISSNLKLDTKSTLVISNTKSILISSNLKLDIKSTLEVSNTTSILISSNLKLDIKSTLVVSNTKSILASSNLKLEIRSTLVTSLLKLTIKSTLISSNLKSIKVISKNSQFSTFQNYDKMTYFSSTSLLFPSTTHSLPIISSIISPNTIHETTIHFNECSAKEIFSNSCKKIIKKNGDENSTTNISKQEEILKYEDNMLENIQKEFNNGNMDSLLSNVVDGEKKDLVSQTENTIYQFTTTENQKNSTNNNISKINLGECETTLKKQYNISFNDSLLILKLDIYKPGKKIPIIEYEVYNSKTKEKLDLNYCNDSKISISVPVDIKEDNLDIYDENSNYYNDICYIYTSENGTDITLSDRKKEFKNNDLSLCENSCNYNGYDKEIKNALCDCMVKTELPLISEILINKDKLIDNFIDIKHSININVMKCYKVLFTKSGIIYNIGNYIILFIILINIISAIFFYTKGYALLYEVIKLLIDIKKNKFDIENDAINIKENVLKKNLKNEDLLELKNQESRIDNKIIKLGKKKKKNIKRKK